MSKFNNIYSSVDLDDYSSNEGDFAYYDNEEDVQETHICNNAWNHKFSKKTLLAHFYRECTLCGYSPELDGDKSYFESCHEKFLNWENSSKHLK